MTKKISKKLSANDVGTTGGHQAGILVPRAEQVLSFFPILDTSCKNPRQILTMHEPASGSRWQFPFIYYNNKFFGGTRNEYRLTHMTRFLRSLNAKAGDELCFSRDEDSSYVLTFNRTSLTVQAPTPLSSSGVLVLSGGWKVVNF